MLKRFISGLEGCLGRQSTVQRPRIADRNTLVFGIRSSSQVSNLDLKKILRDKWMGQNDGKVQVMQAYYNFSLRSWLENWKSNFKRNQNTYSIGLGGSVPLSTTVVKETDNLEIGDNINALNASLDIGSVNTASHSVITNLIDPFTSYPIFNTLASTFVWIHDNVGLSWSATIILLAFILRLGLLMPLNLMAMRKLGALKMAGLMNHQMNNTSYNEIGLFSTSKIRKQIHHLPATNVLKNIENEKHNSNKFEESLFRNDNEEINKNIKSDDKKQIKYDDIILNSNLGIRNDEIKQRRNFILKQFGVNSLRFSIPVIITLPLWLLVTITLRFLTMMPESVLGKDALFALDSLKDEGLIYMTNLTLPDPTLITPILYLSVLLTNIVLQTGGDIRQTRMVRSMYVVRIVLSFVGALFASIVPSAVSLFWVSSAVFMTFNMVLTRLIVFIQSRMALSTKLRKPQLIFISSIPERIRKSFSS